MDVSRNQRWMFPEIKEREAKKLKLEEQRREEIELQKAIKNKNRCHQFVDGMNMEHQN